MTYGEKEARELVVRAGHKLVDCGLVARTWGNISARISDTHFIITPSGLAYETLRPEQLVKVAIADCSYEGSIKPSSEKGVHAAAYRHRGDVGFVIHTHQDYASCIGVSGRELSGFSNPVLDSSVPCAAYGMPSTGKLQKAVEDAIVENPEARAIFMKHHGALCMAGDFDGAFELAQALEDVCRDTFERAVSLPEAAETDAEPLLAKLRAAAPEMHFSAETDPAVQALAALGKTLRPHLDDLAQIAGVTLRCVRNDSGAVLRALKGRNAVLVGGVGAVCCAGDAEDLEAIAAIVRKSCMTALYARSCKAGHLSALDRRLMRLVYTLKYSKKKAEK